MFPIKLEQFTESMHNTYMHTILTRDIIIHFNLICYIHWSDVCMDADL